MGIHKGKLAVSRQAINAMTYVIVTNEINGSLTIGYSEAAEKWRGMDAPKAGRLDALTAYQLA